MSGSEEQPDYSMDDQRTSDALRQEIEREIRDLNGHMDAMIEEQVAPEVFPDVTPRWDPDVDLDKIFKLIQSNARNKERAKWIKQQFEGRITHLKDNLEMRVKDYMWFSQEVAEIWCNLENIKGMLSVEKEEIGRLRVKLHQALA
jgi:hypothetical protein